MKLPSPKVLALNGVAVMIMGAAIVTQIKSFFHVPVTPHCSERYRKAVALGVERGGALLTAADFQASAGGQDHGVIDNLQLSRVAGAPRPAALAISVKDGTSHPDHAREPRGGLIFPWRPRALSENVDAMCLSYDILLPANFDFGHGVGTLPGIEGASAQIGLARNEKFAIHFGWGNGGVARLKSVLHVDHQNFVGELYATKAIPRGEWVRVDQEMVLNTPGQADGVLRLWLGGTLVGDVGGLVMRQSPDTMINTVLASVYFGASQHTGEGRALKDERIMMTPFELRW